MRRQEETQMLSRLSRLSWVALRNSLLGKARTCSANSYGEHIETDTSQGGAAEAIDEIDRCPARGAARAEVALAHGVIQRLEEESGRIRRQAAVRFCAQRR